MPGLRADFARGLGFESFDFRTEFVADPLQVCDDLVLRGQLGFRCRLRSVSCCSRFCPEDDFASLIHYLSDDWRSKNSGFVTA